LPGCLGNQYGRVILGRRERGFFLRIDKGKTLRDMLPLCSFCKKIRDDKGYWEQVDVYIYKYLQADISHGICPECAKEHYPDIDIDDD
jgi:hypothetical protein